MQKRPAIPEHCVLQFASPKPPLLMKSLKYIGISWKLLKCAAMLHSKCGFYILLPILKNSCYTTRGFRKACDHNTCCVNCRVNGNKSRKSHVNKNSKVDLSDQPSKLSRIFSQRSDHLSLWGQVCKRENLGIYWQATATTPQLILVKANGLCTLENRFANPRKTPWQSLKSWQKPAAYIRRLQNWPWIAASTEQST